MQIFNSSSALVTDNQECNAIQCKSNSLDNCSLPTDEMQPVIGPEPASLRQGLASNLDFIFPVKDLFPFIASSTFSDLSSCLEHPNPCGFDSRDETSLASVINVQNFSIPKPTPKSCLKNTSRFDRGLSSHEHGAMLSLKNSLPKARVSFPSRILTVHYTYSPELYDRRMCKKVKISLFNDALALYKEYNIFKMYEMPVHPDSVQNTTFMFCSLTGNYPGLPEKPKKITGGAIKADKSDSSLHHPTESSQRKCTPPSHLAYYIADDLTGKSIEVTSSKIYCNRYSPLDFYMQPISWPLFHPSPVEHASAQKKNAQCFKRTALLPFCQDSVSVASS